MIRINLLPHREEKRKARRQQFYAICGVVAVVAAIILAMGYSVIEGYISAQRAKNDFLKQANTGLDKQIDEIKRLKEQSQALLARKGVIESLQQDRAEAVRLLTEFAKQIPEGVRFRGVTQSGNKVVFEGEAQSNARIATLMRNLEASPWLESPSLIEIKADVNKGKRRLSTFRLEVTITRASNDANKLESGKGGK